METLRRAVVWLRNPRRLAVTLAFFSVSAFVLWGELKRAQRGGESISEPRYLVARRFLRVGLPLQFTDLTLKSVNTEVALPPGEHALTDQDLSVIKNARLRRDLAAGEALTREGLILPMSSNGLGEKIPSGYRAYVIQPATTLKIKKQERVDLYLTPSEPKSVPLILLENVLVLDAGMREGTPEAVIAVSAEQIRLLEKARRTGKLTLALRNPRDDASPLQREADLAERLLRPSRRRPPDVEIWSEDK